jgi:hypothetical protein
MVSKPPYEPQPARSLDAGSLAQWAAGELRRIADFIRPDPSGLILSETHSINIGSAANWQAQYTAAAVEAWQQPAGGWSNPLWTCQTGGIYLVSSRCEIAAFGSDTANYYVGCRVTVDPADGGADDVRAATDGGPDDMPLAVHNIQVLELFRGDTVKHEITAVHATQGGTVSGSNQLSIIKIE